MSPRTAEPGRDGVGWVQRGCPGMDEGLGKGRRGSQPRLARPTGTRLLQGSLLRGQLPPFLNGFFQSSGQVLVRVMGTVSDVLHRLGAHGTEAQGLSVAINARSFFDDVSAPRRGGHPISWPSSASPGSLPRRPLSHWGREVEGQGSSPGVWRVWHRWAGQGLPLALTLHLQLNANLHLSPTCPHPPHS